MWELLRGEPCSDARQNPRQRCWELLSAEAVISGLLAIPPGEQRGAECARRRRLVHEDVGRLGKQLDEVCDCFGCGWLLDPLFGKDACKGALPKVEESTRMASLLRLAWMYERCHNLQDAATILEAHDASHEVSMEYAMLGVDIVLQQDRTIAMVRLLERNFDLPVPDKHCQVHPLADEPGLVLKIFHGFVSCGSGRHDFTGRAKGRTLNTPKRAPPVQPS